MKTPFDALIQAQEQKLNMCELHIVRENNAIAAKQNLITSLLERLSQIQAPSKCNDFALFMQTTTKARAVLYEIDSTHEAISKHKAHIAELEAQHRALYMEFEKLKHIRDKEREKLVKALKKKEQKELDELAILLYKKERV